MEKPLIMVVDDEKKFADSVAIFLQNNGFKTITAYSAKEALAALDKNRSLMGLGDIKIKCIVLDIKMPEMDGLQFLRKLREDYKSEIGVIILSAYGDEEKWSKATAGLVVGYLRKPLKEAALLAHLKMYSINKNFAIEQTRQKLFGERILEDVENIKSKHEKFKEE
ncbi:MAG: two-component system response regulator YesN [Candidatus Saganbacteria bacterium]|uniref:Two-component system response regulator YesN n=1 Tax=Candidatus Saganbacteria bacterium TaxID=2575572 RepID=A0A833L090_UNCSA|nr:MAG: two-component system response regulator YesN [Candidatus Saganbacteria bacterium]